MVYYTDPETELNEAEPIYLPPPHRQEEKKKKMREIDDGYSRDPLQFKRAPCRVKPEKKVAATRWLLKYLKFLFPAEEVYDEITASGL